MWLVDYLTERYGPQGGTVQAEMAFCERKWRFDVGVAKMLTDPVIKFAFEIEGGIFSGGRHTRGAGFQRDMEKYNTAAALGWKVFRFTPEQILKGEAKAFIERYL
jgi:hypothetical protein